MTTVEGERFAGYLLGRRLGAGGMGEVFLATDPEGREVALKLLSSLGESGVARFRRELETGRRLRHRNLIRTLGGGEEDGIPYLVLELLEGRTLEDMVTEGGPLPAGAVLEVARQLTAAVDYLHGEGVVHRDLKPANVFLTSAGVIKVLDLGVARPGEGGTLTRTGAAVGTPLFMAPEQAGGERATAASDRFALGLVVYRLLTGRHAHPPRPSEDPGAYLFRLLSGRLDPWDPLRAGGPLDLFFRRALANREEDRFPSGRSLFDALEEALGAEGLLPPAAEPDPEGSLAARVRSAPLRSTGHALLVDAGPSRAAGLTRRSLLGAVAALGLVTVLLAAGSRGGGRGEEPVAGLGRVEPRLDVLTELGERLSRADVLATVLSGRGGTTGTEPVERELDRVGLRSFLRSRGPALLERVERLLEGGGLDPATLEALHLVWLADAYLRARAGPPLPDRLGPRLRGFLLTSDLYDVKPPAASGRVVFPDAADRFLIAEDPGGPLDELRTVSDILFPPLPAVTVRVPEGSGPLVAEVHMSSGARFERSYFGLLQVGRRGPFLVADLPGPAADPGTVLLREDLDRIRRLFRVRLPRNLEEGAEVSLRLEIHPWRTPSGEVHGTLSVHALGLVRLGRSLPPR